MIVYGFHELVATFLSNITVTEEMIKSAAQSANRYGVKFPEDLFKRVITECGGKIPLKVQVLPEGTYSPAGTPFCQISNTVKGFGELVTWWEAIFLHAHFASSCATEAFKMRQYLEETKRKYGFDDSFMLRFHSFGFRGHRSLEDAYWAGAAWSLFLHGSDDFHITCHYPDAGLRSIPALAHKVVQQFDNEYECFKRAIDVTAEDGGNIVSLVIDTYDTNNVIQNWVAPLGRYAAEKKMHIVFRPDSGDILKQTVDIYDVVKENSLTNVTVIIGESMSLKAAKEADLFFLQNNVPLTFVNYGIGAGFYKHIERDTLGWAMKTAFSNGKPRMKFSEDPLKRSTPGEIGIYRNDKRELIVEEADVLRKASDLVDEFETIYEYDGKNLFVLPLATMDVVRGRAEKDESIMEQQIYIKNSDTVKRMIRDFKNRYKRGVSRDRH